MADLPGGDDDLSYAAYLKDKGGGTATAPTPPTPDLSYEAYQKEKAAQPSSYGLEPSTAPPAPQKPGTYKPPTLAPAMAQPDVTETRKIGPSLQSRLLTENPDPVTRAAMDVGSAFGLERPPTAPATTVEKAVAGAGSMAAHPVDLAENIALTAPRAGAALRRYKEGTGSGREAAIGALQTLALGAAGPLEKLMAERVLAGLGPEFASALSRTTVGGAAGATFTPDDPMVGMLLGGAAGATAIPKAVRNIGDVSEGAVEAGTQALKPPAPVGDLADRPQPLTREQQILRARLQADDINPSGPITRRPSGLPPAVEPSPDVQSYTTPGAVRRPAATPDDLSYAAYQKAEQAPAEAPAVERRAEPTADRPVWTPEERQAYHDEQMAAYDRLERLSKPTHPDDMERRFILGGIERPELQPEAGAPGEPTTWPPLPKEGDIQPIASANGDFEARPGVMRDVNRGVQPTDLPSPMRLPEPTPADRAVVQPKGYKEISPEEVAARKPEPVVTASPKEVADEPATVDESGLFFDHRTPGGALRDVRRVSTDGLIKAHREMQDQIVRDQQSSVYRNVEADVSGTQYGQQIQVGDQTGRGTTYQSEAAERLRNYQKVMGRINGELEKRGLSGADIHDRINDQEQLEAAIEQEAMHRNNAEEDAGDAFGELGEEPTRGEPKAPKEPPPSDVLNVAKLNLGSKTAEQRMAAKLEDFRSQREANKQTFEEADVNRKEILDELRAGDPLALPTEKAKKLTGEELLARRDLVRENDQHIQALSRQMESGTLPPDAYQQASDLVDKAVSHNDALLSDLVTGSSQKGRDLNLLRRLATQSFDPAVWRVQAKRMLGDQPLTAEIDAAIRKFASDAEEACK